MSQTTIFDGNWADIVFENRNKAYGAYQLRKESGRTMSKAFLTGLSLLGLAIAAPAAMQHYSGDPAHGALSPIVSLDDTLHVVKVKMEDVKKETSKQAGQAARRQTPETKNMSHPTVVENNRATEAAPQNENVAQETVSEHPDGTGGVISKGSGKATSDTTGEGTDTPAVPTGPINMGLLDKKPEFPGGLASFYQYISKNFKPTEASEEVEVRLNVAVSFVVETDGSITDIKVLRDPGYGLGNEAIRVLRNLKTRWEPGVFRGEKVRTLYTLPISVKKG